MTNLETLNKFRAEAGLKPIAAWKKSRHQPMLDAYVAGTAVQQAPAEAPRTVAQSALSQSAADAMKPLNEELGQEIKSTRAAWRASGANMTKKDYAVLLMSKGVTVTNMSKKMGITLTAARSLVGDVRRIPGAVVTRVKDTYFVELPVEEEEVEE